MLVIVSPNTIQSKWVTWEVGYGYDNSTLGSFDIIGLQNLDLEAYLQTALLNICGTKSLNEYILDITGRSISIMESYGKIKLFSAAGHTLDNYLVWKL